MRVVLTLAAGAIEFTPINSDGPWPWLVRPGALRIEARAGSVSGFGSGAAPTGSFELDNTGNQASDLIGSPLRARAEIFDDDDVSAFVGLVSSIRFGKTNEYTLES